jgi:pimeloyl-ACP methyl ester carboxylesterase
MIPFIFIPGIQATALAETNSLDFPLVWNAYDSLASSIGSSIKGAYLDDKLQKNPLYDQKISSIVERNHIARYPYEIPLANLSRKFPEDPIYLFGYDWRLSNMENAKRLKLFTDYLLEKLKPQGVRKFRFITHSMGGLVFSCFLKILKNDVSRLDKAIMCAPPFDGALDSLLQMVKGDSGFKSLLNWALGRDESLRKIIRTFPSVFELLPFYKGGVQYGDGKKVDLLNIKHWQSNVYDDDPALFNERLKGLGTFRKGGYYNYAKDPQGINSRLLVVAGNLEDTHTRIEVLRQSGKIKNLLDLKSLKDLNKKKEGDGTVPLISSSRFKKDITTLVVDKENFFEEPGSNFSFHGLFLKDSRVINIISRFFRTTSAKSKRPGAWYDSIGSSAYRV